MPNVILQSELVTVGKRYCTKVCAYDEYSPEGGRRPHEAKQQDLHRKPGIFQQLGALLVVR
jgi:hypothetical protein